MVDVTFHSLYSKSASSWSLLQLDPSCEETLREGKQMWLKGSKFESEVPTLICTGEEVFLLKREKSSNMAYLAIEFERETVLSETGKENFLIFSDNKKEFSVVGNLNSNITMIKIPALLSNLEDFMIEYRIHSLNKNSEIGLKELFDISQTSIKELYDYLFSFDSMFYCDINGKWYSLSIEVLTFLLSSILQKGMSKHISFKELYLRNIKRLIQESLADIETDNSVEAEIRYNSLKHALNFDLTLLQFVKHFVEPSKSGYLSDLLNRRFDEKYIKQLINFPIHEFVDLRDISNMKINLSYRRIQRIFALSIIQKKLVINVKEYIEEFQGILSNYVPLEITEIDFEINSNISCVDRPGSISADLFYGFPILENHPDNIGVRFDIIAGSAYYNEEDDTIVYMPKSRLPNDPRKRLSFLFTKKKYWHISELSSFISPILPYGLKIEAFCIQNCYICERRLFNQNLKFFYNKNLPLD